MTHAHDDNGPSTGSKMKITIALNIVITAVEVVGGIISGSLSLLSDALHNLSDSISLWISFMAIKISGRDKTNEMTFGYKRAQILAAFINASILVGVVLFLFVEAYKRFLSPSAINSTLMISVALVGLAGNLVSALVLRRDSKRNLNVKSSYLHLMADTLSSVVVVGGGIVMYFYGAYWLDPILTVAIGVYLLKETWEIVSETIRILMEATPTGLNLEEIKGEVEALPLVESLHHVHIWQIDDNDVHFEGHVDICEDINIGRADGIRGRIETILRGHGISHINLQIELLDSCSDKSLVKA